MKRLNTIRQHLLASKDIDPKNSITITDNRSGIYLFDLILNILIYLILYRKNLSI